MAGKSTYKELKQRVKELEAELLNCKHGEENIAELAVFPEMNPAPVIKVDREGTILLSNRSARELFQKNEVKMVITDWMMPQIDGLELCKKIRSAGKEDYTYVIVLTAKDQKDDLVEVFNSGADDYIPKPFDHEELKVRIKTGERVIQL